MRRLPFWFYGIILLCSLVQCDTDSVSPPGRLTIEAPQIKVGFEEGTAAHRLSHLYTYVDGAFFGAYQYPASVSLPLGGAVEITIFPGIRENGMIENPIIYPFLDAFNTQVELTTETVAGVQPVFEYKSNTQFRFIDEFDGSTRLSEDLDQDVSTRIQITPEGFEGSGGQIRLNAEHPICLVANDVPQQRLPIDGSPIFLEMHYRHDANLTIGLQAWSQGLPKVTQFIIGLRPQAEWNKIYINFTTEIQQSQLDFYQIVILAEHNDQQEESTVFLDNVKWLHL